MEEQNSDDRVVNNENLRVIELYTNHNLGGLKIYISKKINKMTRTLDSPVAVHS